jgi:hypothetical protein
MSATVLILSAVKFLAPGEFRNRIPTTIKRRTFTWFE